ncbi:MAG: class I SAM-dependent rRNA methyltransferase, partial [Syntrophothermus sp.]
MTVYPRCILKPGKEAAILRKHPWIFSGAVMKIDKVREGDVIEVYSSAGKYLATGHYSKSSITVKILSFEQQEIDQAFWNKKILEAYELRKGLGLTQNELTNACRLVHSEGDGMPGVIIDWYNGTAVIQIHSWGMFQARLFLAESLNEILGERLKAIYNKSFETLKSQMSQTNIPVPADEYLYGQHEDTTILESGHAFHVNWEAGQKTGFFLDQRANRILLQSYSQNKK